MSDLTTPLSWEELNQLAAAVALLHAVVLGQSLPATLNLVNYAQRLSKLEERLVDMMVGRPSR